MATAFAPFGCARDWNGREHRSRLDVSKRKPAPESADASLDLSHLRREARTALELAVVGMAPSDLIDRLAAVAGLLEALVALPLNITPVIALMPKVSKRAHAALADWNVWQAKHLAKAKA